MGEEVGESFRTARGVRQECPINLLLFNILLADWKEETGNMRKGGVRLGGLRIYTLAYADNVILLAEEEGDIKCMLERLK